MDKPSSCGVIISASINYTKEEGFFLLFCEKSGLETLKTLYDNGIKTKETSFINGNIEYTYIFKYEKDLLIKIEGYFSNLQDLDSVVEFKYNIKNQLIMKKVKVSVISSYVNHVIYYEYF